MWVFWVLLAILVLLGARSVWQAHREIEQKKAFQRLHPYGICPECGVDGNQRGLFHGGKSNIDYYWRYACPNGHRWDGASVNQGSQQSQSSYLGGWAP